MSGTNYITDREQAPEWVCFENGRTVGIAYPKDGHPYLVIDFEKEGERWLRAAAAAEGDAGNVNIGSAEDVLASIIPASDPVPVEGVTEDTRCLRCDVRLSDHVSVESCAKFVAATEDHGDPATWSDENLVARGGVVGGVVLPERPKLFADGGPRETWKSGVVEAHFTLLESKLAEAIAQRDALLHYSQLCPEHLSNAYRRHMPAAEGRCASCLLTKATSKRFAAEAALATERSRALQEVANMAHDAAQRAFDRARYTQSSKDYIDEDTKFDTLTKFEHDVLSIIQK